MLDTFGLRDEDILLFEKFYLTVSKHFEAAIIDDLNIPFETFELFSNYSHIGHRQTLQINRSVGKAYLAILQVEYTNMA